MAKLSAALLIARLVARALALGKPLQLSTARRLDNLATSGAPVARPVEITWNRHAVPSIRAESERDLAVGLGLVHAHLRLAQMELMRRLASGTAAEVLGPAAIPLDHALRLMCIGLAVPEMERTLPPATRTWAEGFVDGVNHQLRSQSVDELDPRSRLVDRVNDPARPYPLRLLDLEPRPWTLHDLLLISRLAAADVSWIVFSRLLRAYAARSPAEWNRIWPELQDGDITPSADTPEAAAILPWRGSNAAAVAASEAARGAGLIASDPHLPILLPPVWLIAALHAPGLDAVGLMIPGLPVLALGRNRHLAWGGTSLHAASSELIDVSAEPMTERDELIPVRARPPHRLRIRETRFGPVVSDGPLLRSARPLALRWVGHRPSDEMTAMLGVMRARSLEEFRTALAPFAVPGQTMVAVEAGPGGRAGRVIATHLPRRPPGPAAALVSSPAAVWNLDDLLPATTLPFALTSIVVSANERPDETPVPVGFFFSPTDRADRMRHLLRAAAPVSAADMRALQLDDVGDGALRLRAQLLPRLPPGRARDTIADWDGSYSESSAGALAFEVLVAGLARRTLPPADLQLLSALWTGRALLARRLDPSPAAIRAAVRDADRALRRWKTWGAVHRMSVRDPLARLPVVGRWFATPEFPASGGNETVNKTGHGPVIVEAGPPPRHLWRLRPPRLRPRRPRRQLVRAARRPGRLARLGQRVRPDRPLA